MEKQQLDLRGYQDASTTRERIARLAWTVVWGIFARPIPRSLCSGWKRFLLRCFGAKIHPTATIYSGAHVYAPWNLEMKEGSTLSTGVDCYNADRVTIGAYAIVSQKASLFTASHRVDSPVFEWVSAPIVIGDYAWVAAEAFVMMGVTVGEGAVVGARAAVFKDVEPWTVVGGNPARFIKKREITC